MGWQCRVQRLQLMELRPCREVDPRCLLAPDPPTFSFTSICGWFLLLQQVFN